MIFYDFILYLSKYTFFQLNRYSCSIKRKQLNCQIYIIYRTGALWKIFRKSSDLIAFFCLFRRRFPQGAHEVCLWRGSPVYNEEIYQTNRQCSPQTQCRSGLTNCIGSHCGGKKKVDLYFTWGKINLAYVGTIVWFVIFCCWCC